MPGAERHSGARKWRACSHRAPKKQAKGDGRAAKGQHDQYGTFSWPMEKLMDHYGNVAAERKLRTPGSKRRPAGRFVLVAAPGSVAASASRLVVASALAHGMLRLAAGFGWSAEIRGGVHDMLQCYPAQSGDEAGGVLQAADAKLRTSCSSGDEAGGDVQAADAKLWLHGCRIAAYMSGMARVLIKQYTILN
ncbi:hypothetical protein PF004_g14892 [Phytophthora fragariae]|uniref:Uncharacterized protein n=1 Tax=Phytophthora fragariae TaxID=53985 RepID=A0A6G0NMV6_9STRA|nr:hypothetical protein PF004_g14892 [Phytophthora fragariae]